jgi:hypothetical protein
MNSQPSQCAPGLVCNTPYRKGTKDFATCGGLSQGFAMKCTNASIVPDKPSDGGQPDCKLGLEPRQFAEIVGREIARFWKDGQRSAPVADDGEVSESGAINRDMSSPEGVGHSGGSSFANKT